MASRVRPYIVENVMTALRTKSYHATSGGVWKASSSKSTPARNPDRERSSCACERIRSIFASCPFCEGRIRCR